MLKPKIIKDIMRRCFIGVGFNYSQSGRIFKSSLLLSSVFCKRKLGRVRPKPIPKAIESPPEGHPSNVLRNLIEIFTVLKWFSRNSNNANKSQMFKFLFYFLLALPSLSIKYHPKIITAIYKTYSMSLV